MRIMKKPGITGWVKVLLSFLLFLSVAVSSFGESLLPSLNQALGIGIPDPWVCTGGRKDVTVTETDGNQVRLSGISIEDLDTIGKCFGKSGITLTEHSVDNEIINLTLGKNGETFAVSYNTVTEELLITYPQYYYEDTGSYTLNSDDVSIFPDIGELAGALLPKVSTILNREPDETGKKNGMIYEEFHAFTEDDYYALSESLLAYECEVADYSANGTSLTINLVKNDNAFKLVYNRRMDRLIAYYPGEPDTEPEATATPVPTATPAPTATPRPTVSSDDYVKYAAVFVGIIKATLKNPSSLEVNNIRIMEYDGQMYVVIDFSAMNGFGGYNRDCYSFKFEPGHISLSGNSSDYDTYSKHSSEFWLIETLNVGAVMSLVNK